MSTTAITAAEDWHLLLQDKRALYESPIAHHRELLHQAYALRDVHAIGQNTLAEMLELADAALEHALERAQDELDKAEPQGKGNVSCT
ncbi:hypothetical protein [Pseudomonas sp. SDI]|uniref:hypothetical protein n=1 Tax=Pseudomonas sp. SDI TaxID=2170734 RepID=UPI0015B0DE20|nr:hypothetical protein [Pseudomonas sp. SDI]